MTRRSLARLLMALGLGVTAVMVGWCLTHLAAGHTVRPWRFWTLTVLVVAGLGVFTFGDHLHQRTRP